MRKTLLNLMIGLALISGVVAPAGLAFAEEEQPTSQNAIQVTPSGARLTLSKGDLLEGHAEHCPKGDDGCSITITNIGSAPIRFRIYMSPYVVSGSENELSFAEENATSYTQLYKWITVKNSDGEWVREAEFAAEPNASQTVQYRIEVPEDLPGGSQYAVIWAQIINSGTSEGIETVGQIGAVLTARSTEDVIETAEISDVDLTTFTFGDPLKASATVKNTGNVDFAARYYYSAKTFFGKELFNNGQDDFVAAYPDTTYQINFEWPKDKMPFLGIFQVEWKIIAADKEEVRTSIVVVMPIIVIIVMILLLTVIIVWIIIISRKRKERKARKLV